LIYDLIVLDDGYPGRRIFDDGSESCFTLLKIFSGLYPFNDFPEAFGNGFGKAQFFI